MWLYMCDHSGLTKKESESEVTQSCLTLCDPTDGSLPGSAVHGIFQARILEWAAISDTWVPAKNSTFTLKQKKTLPECSFC